MEAAVCIKGLRLAARAELKAGDPDSAEAFFETARQLMARYCIVHPGGEVEPWKRDALELTGREAN